MSRNGDAGDRIFIATQSFSTSLKGNPVSIVAGVTRVREGHPLMDGDRAQFFEPMTVHFDMEEATSTPSGQRGK